MITESVYLHYLDSLLDGNKRECTQIVNDLVDQKVSIKEIYLQLFQRSMYRVGQLWENKRCSISNEHIATKITEALIEYVGTCYSNCKCCGRTALITCIDKEFHELGARMVAGYFETHGWNVLFVGSNIPQEEVLGVIREKKPNVIGISNNFYVNIVRLVKLVQQIKEEYPDQEIIIGGQALSDGRADEFIKMNNVKYICSLDSLEEYLSAYTQKRIT
jgi:MerR family transcriptional regulator, light-induced transcriptional regulator